MDARPMDRKQLLRLGRDRAEPRGAGVPAGGGAKGMACASGGACPVLLFGARGGPVSAGSGGLSRQAEVKILGARAGVETGRDEIINATQPRERAAG